MLATPNVQSLILRTDPNSTASTVTSSSILRQILHALLLYFANTYDTVFGINAGPPLHDPLAVAVLLSNLNGSLDGKDGLLQFDDRDGERFAVKVVTDGTHGKEPEVRGQLGRTIVSPISGGKTTGGVAIPRGVDADGFWNIVLDCLRRADEWNVARGGRV